MNNPQRTLVDEAQFITVEQGLITIALCIRGGDENGKKES